MAKNKGTKVSKEKKYPIVYLIPLIAALALLPLLVRQYDYYPGLIKYDWFAGDIKTSDFFLHIKMVWLNIIVITMLCFMTYMIFSEEIKPIWDRMLIPLFLYGALCLISAFTSVDSHYSFRGIYEQFEPVWSLLGYVILLYYAFYVLHNDAAVERLLPWFVGGVALMAVFGVMQALGADPLGFKFIQRLYLLDKKNIGNMALVFGKGRVYTSLYNPNYIGLYVVLVFPILLALVMQKQKLWARILSAVLAAALVVMLYASQSRAGIVVLIFTFFLMLLCMRKVFFKNWKLTAAIIIVAVVGFVAVNMMNQNILLDRMRGMFYTEKQDYALENIVTGDDVCFYYQGEELHFDLEVTETDAKMHLTDGEGNEVSYEEGEDGNFTITDPRFPFTFGLDQTGTFKGFHVVTPRVINGECADGYTKTWYFTNQMVENDDSYYLKGAGNALFKMKKQDYDSNFFDHNLRFANGRGFIWSRTLPLLKKYFFLGSGPDTFVIAFPNNDQVGMLNSAHDNEIVTRPHCMYLQIAVQTGVPSLIAFLVFFGWYLLSSFRLYWKESYDGLLPKIGLAVMIGVIGYLIVGLTNDSTITVAPVFFVLTGMGMGINYRLKKEKTGGGLSS